tara:strand:- start:179 stop:793 length:615 start_codon:yes stop_codon:yes gene_type:complete
MAKVTFESIIPEILPSVPECTDLIITRAVRRAAEEFLSKSLIWRVDLEDHFVIAGLADVELETPSSDLRIVQIKKATIDAKDIPQIADAQMPENATQTFCSLVDFNNSLRLTPTPIIAAALSLRVVLSTTSKSTGIDSVVEQEIHEHLIDGALARLYTMQGMPWANNALAGFHSAVFQAAILEARGRAENNSGRAVRKVSYGGL